MVYAGVCRLLFILSLLVIVSCDTLSADSEFPHSDGSIENGSQQTRFRDKRTLDFILHGLAQMLGYRLQRNNAQTATTTSPPSPPTQTSKLITQTTPATPSQIVFLSLSDVDLKRKQTAADSPRHSFDSNRNKHYPYDRYRIGPDHLRGGQNDRGNHYYKPDYGHVSYDDPDHIRVGDDGKSSRIGIGYNFGRVDSGHGKDDDHSSDKSNYNRSHHRNNRVDEYLERIGHYIKDRFRGGKKDKDEDKLGHNSEKSDILKHNGASKVEDSEHVRSEYSMNISVSNQDSSKVLEGQHNGGHDTVTTQAEKKEDTNKSDNDDKKSNKGDLKSPDNTEQKETSVQKFQKENNKEEPLVEKEQSQKSKQEVSAKESVEQEHAHNLKEESSEKDTIDHNGEQNNQEKGRKEEKNKESTYYNQIPAPSLQSWAEDFWNSRYSFSDNSPYSFGLFDTQRAHKDETKDSHRIPEFSFHRPSTDNDSNDFKAARPEPYYHRPQYFDKPRFESVHEWHVSSERRSEKPSFGLGIHRGSSEPTGEFKKEPESSDGVSDSPEVPSANSAIGVPEPSKPAMQRQYVTDSPPMPIYSTSKPKLAQLIHEMEGTKQNPLWPPPFDHAFESTDSSIITHQSDVTLSKKVPGHISPFLLNLYNYTSVSDYLLDLSKKGLLPKQAYRFSEQHAKSDHASQNHKSPVSYVAVVIPNQSKDNSDNSVPPEPSFVGVVYPQRLLAEDTKTALGFNSAKSDSIKNNKTPIFKPFTKSQFPNLSQKSAYNNRDEIQDPPSETHYKPLYRGSSTALESTASSNISGGHIRNYPDSYISPFFLSPETHSNTNAQPYSITSPSDYRIFDDTSQRAKHPAKNSSHYPGSVYDNLSFNNPEVGFINNVPLQGTLLDTESSSNSSDHGHTDKLQHGVPFYWHSFQDTEGRYKASAHPDGSSSAPNSRTPSDYEHEHIYDYPDTYPSSVLQNTGGSSKTNAAREGASSSLNFRHPSNSSEDIYNPIENGNVNHYSDVEHSTFKNTTQPLGSPVSHNSYIKYQDYHENRVYNPSTFSSDGREKLLSVTKPLRLVIPDIQSHTTPGSQSPKLRLVIPDFPQSESSFDYSSGSEQNELKNAAFEDNVRLMTIPPPTPYSDDLGSLKNPEKWVLGDNTPNDKNLKTMEYIRRVSKVHVTGKVQKQPKTNLETV